MEKLSRRGAIVVLSLALPACGDQPVDETESASGENGEAEGSGTADTGAILDPACGEADHDLASTLAEF